jgi:hypothetical protein
MRKDWGEGKQAVFSLSRGGKERVFSLSIHNPQFSIMAPVMTCRYNLDRVKSFAVHLPDNPC